MKIKTLQQAVSVAAMVALVLPLAVGASQAKARDSSTDNTSHAAPANSDAALAAAVRKSVMSRYNFKPEAVGIHIHVVNGVVNLSGRVPSSVRADQAQDAASRVPGVKAIDNRLSWPDNS